MFTNTDTGDTLRVRIDPQHKKQLQTLAARIEAVTGEKLSAPAILRAGIAALEDQAIAATKALGRAKDGELSVQVWKFRTWVQKALGR